MFLQQIKYNLYREYCLPIPSEQVKKKQRLDWKKQCLLLEIGFIVKKTKNWFISLFLYLADKGGMPLTEEGIGHIYQLIMYLSKSKSRISRTMVCQVNEISPKMSCSWNSWLLFKWFWWILLVDLHWI